MRNKSSKKYFIASALTHMIFGILLWMWYEELLFRSLPGHSTISSRLILFGFVLTGGVFGLLIDLKKHRWGLHPMLNLIMGYGIYSMLTYSFHGTLLATTLIISCALSLVYSAWIVLRKKCKENEEQARKLAFKALADTKNIMSCGMSIFMATIAIIVLMQRISYPYSNLSTVTPMSNYDPTAGIESIAEYADSFDDLTVDRLAFAEEVAKYCSYDFGLSYQLNIKTEDLPETRQAYYSDENQMIVLNEDLLSSGTYQEIIMVISHEAVHSTQHRIIDAIYSAPEELKSLYIYREGLLCEMEFQNYNDGTIDYDSYSNQYCEQMARELGAREAMNIISLIERK